MSSTWQDKILEQYNWFTRKQKVDRHFGIKEGAYQLGVSISQLSENLSIARAMQSNSTISRCLSRDQALEETKKSIHRRKQAIIQKNHKNIVGLNKDISGLDEKQFDVCIIEFPREFNKSIGDIYPLMKSNSFVYLINTFTPSYLEQEDFTAQHFPLIWIEEGKQSRQLAHWQYSKNYQFITLGVRGTPALTMDKITPILYLSRLGLYKKLLDYSSYSESNILTIHAQDSILAEACEGGRNYTILTSEDRMEDIRKIVKELEDVRNNDSSDNIHKNI